MMTTQPPADDITLFSLRKDFVGYSFESFKQDMTAALTVALLTVPQAMAYSLLAGLPLSTGLFASIYSSIIASVFGSSRHLIVGPSSAIAILVQAGTAEILYTYYRGVEGPARDLAAMQILSQLMLLIGIIQIFVAGCKLGRLTQFVSHSVVIAYIAGTAIAVAVNQLFPFLGVDNIAGSYSIYEKGVYLVTHLKEIHLPTAIVGLISLALLVGLRRIDKRIPAPVIAMLFAAFAVHVLSNYSIGPVLIEGDLQEYSRGVLLVSDTGHLSELVPPFAFPFFDMGLMNHLIPVAFAVSLLNMLETASVAKSLAGESGQRLSTNQEIFGIGIGNLLSAFIGALPVSGSASRSGLSYALGAQTRAAAIMSSVFVAVIIASFNFLIMHIPLAALAALLLVTAAYIVQPRQFFLCAKSTNSDAFVLWITLLSCIFFSLDIAFYIGIVISITLYLKKSAAPQLVEYDIDDEGELHAPELSKENECKTIRVIKVEGELFFGAADLFQTTLKAIAEDDTNTKVIILQLRNARDIDATTCLALQQLFRYLKKSGRHLVACGMTQQVWDVLSDSGLVEQIGKEHLFIFDEKHPHGHMLRALHHARMLAEEREPVAVEAVVPSQVPVLAKE